MDTPWRSNGGADHTCLHSERGGEGSPHISAALSTGMRASGAHWADTKMGPKFGLQGLKTENLRLSGIEPHFLRLTARSLISTDYAIPALDACEIQIIM